MEGQTIQEYFAEKYKNKRFLNIKELSEELGMTDRSIRNAIATGKFPIPTLKIGKFRLAVISAVVNYLLEQESKGRKEFNHWQKLHGR